MPKVFNLLSPRTPWRLFYYPAFGLIKPLRRQVDFRTVPNGETGPLPDSNLRMSVGFECKAMRMHELELHYFYNLLVLNILFC